jgi:uncharacterized repeat protein (TIGR01451 family)
MSLLVGLLAALMTSAGTAAAAEGPDLAVSKISGGSIFGGVQPTVASSTDPHAVELGVRFESQTPLAIEGIRFFKGAKDTGTHVGHLWNSEGTLLASATFTEESASGWQSVRFQKPVQIEPHTVYIASYYAPNGGYAEAEHFFESGPVVSGPLTALQGVNGVYKYGTTSEFPTETWRSSNYYVDVMYSTSITAGQQATFTLDAANVGTSASGAATLKDPLPAGLSWSQDDPSECAIEAGTLTCHLNTLEPGAERKVHLTATTSNANCNQVTRTGVITNTASVSDANPEDTDTSQKSASANVLLSCPVPQCPRPTTSYPTVELGSPYALFALDGIRGKQVGTLSGATIHGAAATVSGASLQISSPSTLTGNLYLESGSAFTGPLTVGGTISTGANLAAPRLIASVVNVLAGALKPNFSYASVTSNTTVTGVAGLNVVNVKGNINLSNAALTLTGPANAYFVLNVGGTITLSGSGAIKVGGSTMSTRVLVNMTGGGAISTGPEDIIEGTLLGLTSGGTLGGGFGNVLLGANFSLLPGSQVGLQSCQ